MSVLIGCSPSTGSSLLRRMLNRHSEIFCGSETYLFSKEALYTDWQKSHKKIMRPSLFGLTNAGWHIFVGVELGEDYNYSKLDFKHLLAKKHDDFSSFVHAFYEPLMKRNKASVWVEKSPSNAFTLDLFLDQFTDGKAIHIVRDPLDVIASLYNRGMSMYNATAVCLLNMSKILSIPSDKIITIKYEALVANATEVLSDICSFLELSFEPIMLLPQRGESGGTTMKGWNYDETQKVEQGSVGRFQKLDVELQEDILKCIYYLRQIRFQKFTSIAEIRKELYHLDTPVIKDSSYKEKLVAEKAADIHQRHFSNAYFKKQNYPLVINDE